MDLLDRLLGHDAWTTGELLRRCRELTDEQLDHEFDIGHKTVRATLGHLIWNMEAWSDQMAGAPLRADGRLQPGGRSIDAMTARLDRAADDLAAIARAVARHGDWDRRWLDTHDDPPSEKSYGGAIAHVITHSMHHRAQVLYMMKKLGLNDLPEGDVLGWEWMATRGK